MASRSRIFGMVFLSIVWWPLATWPQGVDYQRVQAEGIGASYDDAVKQALIQAVGQVNGIEVAQRVVNQSTQGSGTVTTTNEATEVTNTATQGAAVAVGATSADDSSHKQDTTSQVAVVEGAAAAQSVSNTVGAQVTKQEFAANKSIVDSSASTSGVVSRYQVVNSEKKDDGWHVLILADIGVYKPSAASEREKVAVIPLRLDREDDNFRKFESAFRSNLINQLTQSSKLAVLDRDFTAEDQAELGVLSEGNARKDQIARLGNTLGADYLVVGVINDASVHTQSVYMPSIGKAVIGPSSASAKITYRLIEAATGEIDQADSWVAGGAAGSNLDETASAAAHDVSRRILDALFPIRVEHIAGGVFYLGQGGDTIRIGQKYRIIKLGEVITDSYTKEVIGREEADIGTIQVFEVEARLAKARMMDGTPQPDGNVGGALVARLLSDNPLASVQAPGGSATGKEADQSRSTPAPTKNLLNKEDGNW